MQKLDGQGRVPDAKYVRALQRITALTVKRPAMSTVGPAGSPGARRARLKELLEGKR